MRQLVMGCAVAAFVALTAKTEANPPVRFLSASERLTSPPGVSPKAGLVPPAMSRGELGLASWYGEESNGTTASGEVFDQDGLTAAHRTLPLGSKIEVTNLRNNKSLVLRVNDRGPNLAGRLVDVSQAAARRLGFLGAGRTPVRVKVVSLPKQYLAWLDRAASPCMARAR